MADDFHGTAEWQVFEESMKRVFPDRPIIDNANTRSSSARSLRPRRDRPRGCRRPAEQRDELAASCMTGKKHCES